MPCSLKVLQAPLSSTMTKDGFRSKTCRFPDTEPTGRLGIRPKWFDGKFLLTTVFRDKQCFNLPQILVGKCSNNINTKRNSNNLWLGFALYRERSGRSSMPEQMPAPGQKKERGGVTKPPRLAISPGMPRKASVFHFPILTDDTVLRKSLQYIEVEVEDHDVRMANWSPGASAVKRVCLGLIIVRKRN
ncbi:hypothetical protein SAY87_006620 [Trapa incisa]|uniref:Uncharacterized protein n=1 Tax=Trapa incisa TaxID=236973 RepID=A0AAN7JWS3_9MYRT|nr:hypothetical protein SAY87_006620 [Trapa incisa]